MRRQQEQLWEHRCLKGDLGGEARVEECHLGACWRVCGAGGAVPLLGDGVPLLGEGVPLLGNGVPLLDEGVHLLGRGVECQLPLDQGEDCYQKEVGSSCALFLGKALFTLQRFLSLLSSPLTPQSSSPSRSSSPSPSPSRSKSASPSR